MSFLLSSTLFSINIRETCDERMNREVYSFHFPFKSISYNNTPTCLKLWKIHISFFPMYGLYSVNLLDWFMYCVLLNKGGSSLKETIISIVYGHEFRGSEMDVVGTRRRKKKWNSGCHCVKNSASSSRIWGLVD